MRMKEQQLFTASLKGITVSKIVRHCNFCFLLLWCLHVLNKCPTWQNYEDISNPDCVWISLPVSHSPTHPFIFGSCTWHKHTQQLLRAAHSPIISLSLSFVLRNSSGTSPLVSSFIWPKPRSRDVGPVLNFCGLSESFWFVFIIASKLFPIHW